MKAVIVVPYRGVGMWHEAGELRVRNWRYARDFWRLLKLPVVSGDSPVGERFDVTKARNAAVREATDSHPDWEVALMADADVFLDSLEQAHIALQVAHETGAYVVAHSELWYLGPTESNHVIRGMAASSARRVQITGATWETAFAFSRELWEDVGGFDPRFRGFGHQVEAFFHACSTLAGNRRIEGRCYHLWHPYSAESPHPDLPANRELVERYWTASGDEPAMRALLAEYAVAA